MTDASLTRRGLFAAAGAAGAAAALAPMAGLAATPMQGAHLPTYRRFKLGAFEVTALVDGTAPRDAPETIFGIDQDPADVAALLEDSLLPTDKAMFYFTPTVVNTGSQVLLFDTGLGAGARAGGLGRTRALLAETGIAPEAVDTVVLTHFHPDHIGGLMEDGAPAFPNAQYVTAAAEYDFWSPEERLSGPTERVAKLTASNVVPLADKISFITPGDSIASGIDTIDASGHTPGHTAVHLESEGQRLMIVADTAAHYIVSLQRPDWHLLFDMDKEKAAATRKQIFGMIAADKIPFIGYHMPSVGFIEPSGDAFRFVAATYQLDL
ncbi:MAG: MBL fold metallo-hydrolase [Pseudomonadota bacterium]